MPTLNELNVVVEGELRGNGEVEITGVASLEKAGPNDIAPLESDQWLHAAEDSAAGAFLVSTKVTGELARPVIVAEFTLAALNRVIEALGLVGVPAFAPGIHETAVIDPGATLGAELHVGPYAVVGAASIGDRCVIQAGVYVESDVTMGEDCVIEPHAVLHNGCRLGDRVRIGAHAVISSQGFGYAPTPQGPVQLHHIGTVTLEDDVHLGAGVMVDRARFDDTRIGRFSALDNLVHIGHNCTIGSSTFVAAQAALAGNTHIGSQCEIGGQAGFGNRSGTGDRCRVAGGSGVTKMFPDGVELLGYPAQLRSEFARQHAMIRKMAKANQPSSDDRR